MDKPIIENLKILSECFNHKSDAFSNSTIFVNEVNKISVQLKDETNFSITYNLHFDKKTLLVPEEKVYHFCLSLFKRKNDDVELPFSIKKTIEIGEWFKIEQEESVNIIREIEKELDYNYRLKHLFLESARFEITYCNGLLILEDKEKEYFSNVFNFRKIQITTLKKSHEA
ncbi:hypothetical protein [uncultured Flavobacterium sp.]|uniref:hypothetical protein n=1 Tax=uncultured Flavobacterium sp. TaxID=165435 RepID=UPI00259529B2|nr:hypothetical protein [uncultured Flavobacterium sp.]